MKLIRSNQRLFEILRIGLVLFSICVHIRMHVRLYAYMYILKLNPRLINLTVDNNIV